MRSNLKKFHKRRKKKAINYKEKENTCFTFR